MSEQSAKPYLVRAICEWCADNGLTPYLNVRVNAETRVPAAYVKNGEIVLNLSYDATHRLTIGNERIQFAARFGGVSRECSVPVGAVTGIFAKENGQGMMFSREPAEGQAAPEPTPPASTPNGGKPKLQIIK